MPRPCYSQVLSAFGRKLSCAVLIWLLFFWRRRCFFAVKTIACSPASTSQLSSTVLLQLSTMLRLWRAGQLHRVRTLADEDVWVDISASACEPFGLHFGDLVATAKVRWRHSLFALLLAHSIPTHVRL